MRVKIENFQSIAAADLDCRGLTVIVGPSNHGKSAVLRAIEGALWNRPGDHIVRRGATNASVTLADLPGLGTVQWVKGRANRYQINGVDYTRVGASAPQPLQDAGYRDVWIGDADKRKGESIRPQVAGQYDPPLFPLTRSGAFLADVLGVMSHHQTVATAQDRCVSDLRAAAQLAGVRRTDMDRLQELLQGLTDVAGGLLSPAQQAQVEAALARARTIEALRQLRHRRAAVRAVAAARPLPAPAPPVTQAQAVLKARTWLAQRAALAAVPCRPRPQAEDSLWRVKAKVVAGLQRRRRLAHLPAPTPQTTAAARALQAYAAAQPVWDACRRRRPALDTLQRAHACLRETGTEYEACKAQLAALQADKARADAERPRCPACGQPLSG